MQTMLFAMPGRRAPASTPKTPAPLPARPMPFGRTASTTVCMARPFPNLCRPNKGAPQRAKAPQNPPDSPVNIDGAQAVRIAQVSPLFEAVPPRLYGGTERIISNLTEELVARGHD